MNRRAFLGLLLGAPAFPKVTVSAVNRWSVAVEAARARALLADLVAVTRRAFVPKMVVHLYRKSPLLDAFRSQSAVQG